MNLWNTATDKYTNRNCAHFFIETPLILVCELVERYTPPE